VYFSTSFSMITSGRADAIQLARRSMSYLPSAPTP
jgi:hypothetical protein